ncbi:3-hydroxyisobutyrate dehydrogenase-like protein [Candidatus Rhodobacter oscarellae]|uniref:3-hydroxyisobutyrate dehydrogenase-like protein n=1 Tax=Candidatus Rhodobacter oscarellae TaxID=1675527 RepID=A0A0J9EF68_9RHOB|nr:NAD(P)-dependent oxidoreductase [Candidatus Rhodobacter lobularis]KMW60324.1 3-hydroxyisobutyrate dehydrogenase-like protein [Candidatus Rhodobacter lobularis]
MKLAFIGMGEAGSALITGWGAGRFETAAYDRKTDDPATREEMQDRYKALKIKGAGSLSEALAEADLVISVVTADQANAVAEAAAPHLNQGAFFCDLNSCAPSAKQKSALAVEAAGARYVDVAVMAPVHPALNAVPCLISGPRAEAVKPLLDALPMTTRIVTGDVGRASTIKMVRSVLIKGLEALTAEFMLAVSAADVADEVLPSLELNYPGFDWDAQATYNFERAMVHGVRRAAEMEEVCKTLRDLGLPDVVTQGTVQWERWLAAVPVAAPEDPKDTDARALAAAILPHIRD